MFLVVFRNRKRAGIDDPAYQADAARMEELAREQPGYLGFKSYVSADGEVIALSEWADEAAARAWGRHPEHAVIQGRGRQEYYQDYTLFACGRPRIHTFDRSQA
ncbi:MAG: antibiotic biosynthesis monooxygenase [Novosphingobium sp.]